MRKGILVVLTVLFSLSAASAQTTHPTCKDCPGTYIQKQELEAYVQRAIKSTEGAKNHMWRREVAMRDVTRREP